MWGILKETSKNCECMTQQAPCPGLRYQQNGIIYISAADRGQLRYSACYAGEIKVPHKPAELTADKVKITVLMCHAWVHSSSQIHQVVGLGEDLIPE